MTNALSHEQLIVFFLSVACLLAAARLFGEIAHQFGQPAVLGEILAGIVLGPTILGSLFPELNLILFPKTGLNAIVLNSISTLAVVFFLLAAGLEVDLSTVVRMGRKSFVIGFCGLVAPMSIGFFLGWFFPNFVGSDGGADRLVFALFLGTALSISALPVIAKTLMDLKIFKTDLGMTVIAGAIFHDLTGWMIFAVILNLMRTGGTSLANIAMTVGQTLLFFGLTLTLGRWLINRILPWLQAYTSWPGGILGFIIVLGLIGATITEWLGVHAIFGAFLMGVAIGDSKHLRQHTRTTIEQFIGFIFAPLFFASIGLKVNFIASFDWQLTIAVIVIGGLGMVLGCGFAALWMGFPKREAWSIGFALNARGAMEIILGLLALEAGIIGEGLFVALVVMALFTSLICGPLLKKILRLQRGKKFSDFLSPTGFISDFRVKDRFEAIDKLSQFVAAQSRIPAERVAQAVKDREETMSTALPNGVAIPHARFVELGKPVLVVGLSDEGVDFDSGDGLPSKVIIMVLTPDNDSQVQLEIISDVAKIFHRPEIVQKVLDTKNLTEFMALINMERTANGSVVD